MTRIMVTIPFIFLLTSTVCMAQMSDHVAYFKNVTGKVSVLRENNTEKATEGSRLKRSDVVKTHSNSSAGIVFIDNTRLSLGENTEVSLNKYKFVPMDKDYAFSIYMKKGKALYSSGKLSKLSPEDIKIQTPRATVGVRGTKFLVQVD